MFRQPALAVVLIVVGVTACSSSAKVDQTDLAAAQACTKMATLVADKGKVASDGPAVLDAAKPLLNGAAEARAKGRRQPKYANLGHDLVAWVPVGTGDPVPLAGAITAPDAATFTLDGNKVLNECYAIPAAAKVRAGYKGKPAS